MRFSQNPYNLLGLGLGLAGAVFAVVFYFLLHSTSLTALGISMVILGAVCLALGRTRPKVPPEVSSLLLRTGLENTAALVEELGLRSKAIYLPSLLTGRPQALIPMRSNPSLPQVKKALPQRLIVKYGPGPEDVGLLVTTPGSSSIGMLELKPGSSPGELEAAITSLLVGMLDLADGASASVSDKKITIEVMAPRLEYENMWLYQSLGSPLASILASLTSEALEKPITIEREEREKGKSIIELGVLE